MTIPAPMKTPALTIDGSPLRLMIAAREVNPGQREIFKAKIIPRAMNNTPNAPNASQRLRVIPGTKSMRNARPILREVRRCMSLDMKRYVYFSDTVDSHCEEGLPGVAGSFDGADTKGNLTRMANVRIRATLGHETARFVVGENCN